MNKSAFFVPFSPLCFDLLFDGTQFLLEFLLALLRRQISVVLEHLLAFLVSAEKLRNSTSSIGS